MRPRLQKKINLIQKEMDDSFPDYALIQQTIESYRREGKKLIGLESDKKSVAYQKLTQLKKQYEDNLQLFEENQKKAAEILKKSWIRPASRKKLQNFFLRLFELTSVTGFASNVTISTIKIVSLFGITAIQIATPILLAVHAVIVGARYLKDRVILKKVYTNMHSGKIALAAKENELAHTIKEILETDPAILSLIKDQNETVKNLLKTVREENDIIKQIRQAHPKRISEKLCAHPKLQRLAMEINEERKQLAKLRLSKEYLQKAQSSRRYTFASIASVAVGMLLVATLPHIATAMMIIGAFFALSCAIRNTWLSHKFNKEKHLQKKLLTTANEEPNESAEIKMEYCRQLSKGGSTADIALRLEMSTHRGVSFLSSSPQLGLSISDKKQDIFSPPTTPLEVSLMRGRSLS